MKRLAVICARGGSKGVKGKNLRQLAGKPLIAHSIAQAWESGMFDTVAVSSDSAAILKQAEDCNVAHLIERPPELASDTAAKVPAIRHCMVEVEKRSGLLFETIVDLDATAPLRNIDDIRGAITLLEQSGAPNVVSGMPARRSPYYNLVEFDEQNRIVLCKPPAMLFLRRQDSPPCFDLNASVFAWTRACLLDEADVVLGEKTRLYVMPEERSIDIDTEADFKFVKFMMAERDQNK